MNMMISKRIGIHKSNNWNRLHVHTHVNMLNSSENVFSVA